MLLALFREGGRKESKRVGEWRGEKEGERRREIFFSTFETFT